MLLNNAIRLTILILLTISVTACQLAVPFIQGFKDVGLTEADRVQLFSKRITNFHHSLSDGNRTRLLAYAADDYKTGFRDVIRNMGRNEKVVNANVDLVDFKEASKVAEVDVLVKYFRQTDFIVKERLVRQSWSFETGADWYLTDYKVIDDNYSNSID